MLDPNKTYGTLVWDEDADDLHERDEGGTYA